MPCNFLGDWLPISRMFGRWICGNFQAVKHLLSWTRVLNDSKCHKHWWVTRPGAQSVKQSNFSRSHQMGWWDFFARMSGNCLNDFKLLAASGWKFVRIFKQVIFAASGSIMKHLHFWRLVWAPSLLQTNSMVSWFMASNITFCNSDHQKWGEWL